MSTPQSPGRRRWMLPAAVLVAAAVIVGIVFGVLAATGIAPFGDDDGPAAADPAQQAGIEQAVHRYFDALNSGDAAAFTAAICPAMAESFGEIDDRAPLADPITPTAVADVQVDGDSATASVTVSAADKPDDTETVHFRDLDGWRLCQVP